MAMEKLENIDKSLTQTIISSDLQGVSTDLMESILDSTLNEGLLRDIPVLGSIVGLGKSAITIRDRIFLKKILSFLSGIGHVSDDERRKMIEKIDNNKNTKIKVGEKLIYLLDKCDDHISAEYISQFFCAYLKGKISYQDFLRGGTIIQNIFLDDLRYFLDNELSHFKRTVSSEEAPTEDEFPLINMGILGFGYESAEMVNQFHYEYQESSKVFRSGRAVVWVSDIGEKLKSNLTTIK